VIDFVLHFDKHLLEFVRDYGSWVYALLFTIVFAETGFVVTPFLPGDSLLFATGALCATGALSTPVALVVLATGAFTGNAVNYTVGRIIGPRVFSAADHTGISHKLLNREHLRRAHEFFEGYGGKAVILGRFVPIVRTFCPPVAGAAQMPYTRYLVFDIFGGMLWVGAMILGGYFLGRSMPNIGQRIHYVIAVVVLVSVLPVVISLIRARRAVPRGEAQ